MSGALFAIAALVWLGAAFAAVRLMISGVSVYRAAPAGEGMPAVRDLATLNHPAVEQRIGADAARLTGHFRKALTLFACCVLVLVGLTVVNIALGKAA